MKKKFKKAVAVVLTVAMAMSAGVPAFAAKSKKSCCYCFTNNSSSFFMACS